MCTLRIRTRYSDAATVVHALGVYISRRFFTIFDRPVYAICCCWNVFLMLASCSIILISWEGFFFLASIRTRLQRNIRVYNEAILFAHTQQDCDIRSISYCSHYTCTESYRMLVLAAFAIHPSTSTCADAVRVRVETVIRGPGPFAAKITATTDS